MKARFVAGKVPHSCVDFAGGDDVGSRPGLTSEGDVMEAGADPKTNYPQAS